MPQQFAEAFADDYRATYTRLLAYVERRIWDKELAKDITAETYRVSWVKALEGERLLLPQLYRVCYNLIGDSYRRTQRERQNQLMARALIRPSSSNDGHLLECLELLSEPEREILRLKYWEKLTAAEISQATDCTEQAAWTRLSRARASLKKILEEKGVSHV